MKKAAILCLLLISPCFVRADMTITQSVQTGGETHLVVLKVKGDKVRTDIGEQTSNIVDQGSGDSIVIIHSRKSYMKISSKEQELLQQAKAPQATPPVTTYQMNATTVMQNTPAPSATPATGERPKLVDIGKKEMVNGYNADVYTAETPTVKFTYWIATEFPDYAAVQEQLKKMETSAQSKPGAKKNLLPDTSNLKGVPVKMEITKNGKTTTVIMVSANELPVADADMAPPEGYTEVKMPQPGAATPVPVPRGGGLHF